MCPPAPATTSSGKSNPLQVAAEKLRQAVTALVPGQERWSLESLRTALATLTEILAQHERAANDGLFAEVDETRPSLARQEDQLRREHRDLLERGRALDDEIRLVLETTPANASMSIPSDISVRAEQLALDLEEHGKAETCLVLDSINTDIGAGD